MTEATDSLDRILSEVKYIVEKAKKELHRSWSDVSNLDYEIESIKRRIKSI